jgi:hypothetical protein
MLSRRQLQGFVMPRAANSIPLAPQIDDGVIEKDTNKKNQSESHRCEHEPHGNGNPFWIVPSPHPDIGNRPNRMRHAPSPKIAEQCGTDEKDE